MFLCQLADLPAIWEEVDQFVFDNHDKAIGLEGVPRYNGNRAACVNGEITIQGKFSGKALAQVMRMFNLENIKPEAVQGGFLRTTEFIRFNIKGRKVIHEINGTTYRAA